MAHISLLFVFLFLSLSFSVQANDTDNLSNKIFSPQHDKRQSIDPYLTYFTDPLDQYELEDIISGQAGEFKPLIDKSFGFNNKGVIWFKFQANFKDASKPAWWILHDTQFLDEFTVYYPDKGSYASQTLKSNTILQQREFTIPDYIIRVVLTDTTKQLATYYIKVKPGNHGYSAGFSWMVDDDIVNYLIERYLILGLLFGGLILMWLYNAVLFSFVRSKIYALYLYYLGTTTILFIYLNGFGNLLGLPDKYVDLIFSTITLASIHASLYFAMCFLETKLNCIRTHHYLKISIWLTGITFLSTFIFSGNPFQSVSIVLLFAMPALILAGAIRSYQGFVPGQLYLIGWIFYAIATLAYVSRALGFTGPSFFTNFGLMAASAWESAFFAFALAYQIKIVTTEKIKALKLAEDHYKIAEDTRIDALLKIAESFDFASDKQKGLSLAVRDFENEKRRLSQDFHDELSQRMAALKFAAALLKNESDPKLVKKYSKNIVENISQMEHSVSTIIDGLRPALLEALGLVNGIKALVKEMETSILSNCKITLEITEDLSDSENGVQVAIFRVVQESLVNIAKHSNAKSVTVSVYTRDVHDSIAAIIEIQDDGIGFNNDPLKNLKPGHGINNMKERIESLGGRFAILSSQNNGAKVVCMIENFNYSIK